jgi:hypothetical protein
LISAIINVVYSIYISVIFDSDFRIFISMTSILRKECLNHGTF